LPQIESLSSQHSCLWFDNRGMGLSEALGDAKITVEQMSSDALAVLDAAHWAQAHVVGHSLGGCIALELALSSPERVRSLSLLCTSADGPGLVRLGLDTLWRGVRMQIGTRASRRRAFLEIVLTPSEHATGDLERIARELLPMFGHDLALTPPIVLKQVRAMRSWSALDRLIALKDMPTLVLGAEHDLIARPEAVRRTAEAIPGARWVELPDAAHGVTVRAPKLINDLLREHIASVESRRPAGGLAVK
jgi:pimeloyl-ACP methyl ester carboxylesterase